MGKTDPTPDPLRADLDEAWRQHQLLAAKVPPGQGEGSRGRSGTPVSRPPLQIDPVSHMDDLRRYLHWWISQARWTLQPTKRIDITTRTGARCPYCYGDLIAWIYGTNPEPPEVVCRTPEADIHARAAPEGGMPWRWERHEWPRLGVLTGMRIDHRYGARPPGAVAP